MNWTTLFKKFTNGKYIVGLLAVAFLSIGSFSSAYVVNENISLEYGGPNFTLPNEEYVYTITPKGDYANDDIKVYTSRSDIKNCGQGCTITKSDWYYQDGRPGGVYAGPVYLKAFGLGNTFNYVVSYDNGQTMPIIFGGTANFTPIITKLSNIAGEFIPYMIYIAIACLGVTLAFKALRYIISYLQSKSKGAVRGK